MALFLALRSAETTICCCIVAAFKVAPQMPAVGAAKHGRIDAVKAMLHVDSNHPPECTPALSAQTACLMKHLMPLQIERLQIAYALSDWRDIPFALPGLCMYDSWKGC